MYLSYSGYKIVTACLLAYWHKYINRTTVPRDEDRLGSIYGSAVGELFEAFYNEELWRDPNCQEILEKRAPDVVDAVIKKETTPTDWHPAGILLWRGEGEGQNPKGLYLDRDELVGHVVSTVASGIQSIREFCLVSTQSKAEVQLDAIVDGHKLVGRADFVIENRVRHGDNVIIDGKGTRHNTKFLDPRQLKWYSMLYREHKGKAPDRSAFLLWQLEPPLNIHWYDFSDKDLDNFKAEVLKVVQDIEERKARLSNRPSVEEVFEEFVPKPSHDNCRWCIYATEKYCPKGYKVNRKGK